ncbi:MAG: hypothetical protein JSU65_01635 [Candidatus Zixiibacteriota bacterium]|nr:MAG: hypothetical protein JSU65_01635 [candidate division Zixibacteria bacterium]
MKRFAYLAVLPVLLLVFGCGGDDGDENGNGPAELPKVVAFTASAAPSATDLGDEVWDSASGTIIDVPAMAFSPPIETRSERSTAVAVSDQIVFKAIVFSDTLYVRATWDDASHDVWPDNYEVVATEPSVLFSVNPSASVEDQFLLLFEGQVGEASDVMDAWHWRALRTASKKLAGDTLTGFAEGKTFDGSSLTTDEGDKESGIVNPPRGAGLSEPKYWHEDVAEFTDYFFYVGDDSLNVGGTTGWTVGQRVPGWMVDSSLAASASAPYRLSRWDVWALSAWDDGTKEYTVVLRCPLNTGYSGTDDINLAVLDSVKVKAAITDNRDFVFNQGSTSQGITGFFWIVLN